MEWTHSKPADGRIMPWKNGGGTTLELAVHPPGANLETGFHWRLSSAEVGVSGPFSSLPGIDRWLLLLEGNGFEVDFESRGRVELTEPMKPIRFSGDWPASAHLIQGPCTDLNLMVNAKACRGEMAVLPMRAPLSVPLGAACTLLFVARGTLCVPALDLHLGMRHLLRIDQGRGPLLLAPGLAGATLVRMDLHELPSS